MTTAHAFLASSAAQKSKASASPWNVILFAAAGLVLALLATGLSRAPAAVEDPWNDPWIVQGP